MTCATLARLTFASGWLMATVVTTAYERYDWPFWPTALAGGVLWVTARWAIDRAASRITSRDEETA